MKRKDLLRHLTKHGCRLVREGGNRFDLGKPREWSAGARTTASRDPRIHRREDLPATGDPGPELIDQATPPGGADIHRGDHESLLRDAPSGRRVGLTGVWSSGLPPILPAFGPRLGNRVAYVGPWAGHLLRQYDAPAPFARALDRGRIELLVIGLGFPQPHPSVREESWAIGAGFREVARSSRLALYSRGT